MYTGNGAAKEFPLPEGADILWGPGGCEVWLTPPGGDAIRMEQGTAYTVSNGAVFFVIPPPEGWTVSFSKPEEAEAMRGGYVVVYADGTMRTVSGDPAEMLEQAQTMLTAAKAEREALVKTIAAKAAEISVAAEGAKAVMNDRLLNNSALAEKAIEAAAAAVKQDSAKQVAEVIEELRAGQKNVMVARGEIAKAREEIREAAQTSADWAAAEAKQEVQKCCEEALKVWERFRALKPELEDLAAQARNAAAVAGREVTQSMTARCETLLEEIRSVRARLERDVIQETERTERRRAREAEEIVRIRDETVRAAVRMDKVEEACRGMLTQAREEEGRTRAFAEKAAALETALNARLLRGTRRGGR